MKANTNRHEELLRYYQTWLMDYTKLTVRHGICRPSIFIYHNLTVGRLYFPGKEPVIAIVPQRLQKIIYGKSTEASLLSLDDDLNISLCIQEHLLAHHPMLEGILLSECVRLKQRPLANRLISLFQQFSGTELRLQLVWLCWYDLMLGHSLVDWTESLKFKTPEEVDIWIIGRQTENRALANETGEYVEMAYRTVFDFQKTVANR
ncbi:hypothetical protein FNI38_10920 [Salmonella enterica subsp. diarizonae]|nr:hypothetical protein [Salmonella enterica subsp. diarizonae]